MIVSFEIFWTPASGKIERHAEYGRGVHSRVRWLVLATVFRSLSRIARGIRARNIVSSYADRRTVRLVHVASLPPSLPRASDEVARSIAGIQEITRCLSESIRLMVAVSGPIKTGLSVVLNHELTYGRCLRRRHFDIPARTPAVSSAEIRFSPADRVFGTARENETSFSSRAQPEN